MKFTPNLQQKTTRISEIELNKNLSSNNNKNLHQNIISNLNFQLLSINSKILPLFRTHIVRAKTEELLKQDKQVGSTNNPYAYTQNSLSLLINRNKKNINKLITNQILKIFLKGLIKYNLNIKSYMLQTNKLNFLINIKK